MHSPARKSVTLLLLATVSHVTFFLSTTTTSHLARHRRAHREAPTSIHERTETTPHRPPRPSSAHCDPPANRDDPRANGDDPHHHRRKGTSAQHSTTNLHQQPLPSTNAHHHRRASTTIDARSPPLTHTHHHRRAPTTIDARPPPSTRAYYHPRHIHNGAQRSPTRLDRTEQRR